jgi:hypothetical protein
MADHQIDRHGAQIPSPALPRVIAQPGGDGRKPASPLDGINATARWSATHRRPRFVTRWWTGSQVLSRTSPPDTPEYERGIALERPNP